MKKLAIAIVLATALLIPATAGAKAKTRVGIAHFSGTVSPTGTVDFNVARIKKPHRPARFLVGRFNFVGIPLTCADGAHTTHGTLLFAVKVVNGQFTMQASNASGASTVIHGSLARASASGTLQLDGNGPVDPSGSATDCHSGVLNWTASF